MRTGSDFSSLCGASSVAKLTCEQDPISVLYVVPESAQKGEEACTFGNPRGCKGAHRRLAPAGRHEFPGVDTLRPLVNPLNPPLDPNHRISCTSEE